MKYALLFAFIASACFGEIRIVPTVTNGSATLNEEIEITYFVINVGKREVKFASEDQWHPTFDFVSFDEKMDCLGPFVLHYEPKKNQVLKSGEKLKSLKN